jgi:hypothetical protein
MRIVVLAMLAVHLLAACSAADLERFRGRTPDQVKQACDPERQTREECARTLDR